MIKLSPISKRICAGLAAGMLSLYAHPILAGDPFRVTNPKPIGDATQAAFNVLFKEGNYKEAAERYLPQAELKEPNEPMVYAMQASLAYTDWQGSKDSAALNSLKSYTAKTLATAEKLKATDSLRGSLYQAVGYAMEAAVIVGEDGTVKGAPAALSKLQQVYGELDEAQKFDPNDPEVNLLKGWLDLIISVNLPFSDPQQAIDRLQKSSPAYLAHRGMAVGYRDLKNYEDALQYVDLALKDTPNNPELQYLKAQILVKQQKYREAGNYFQVSLQKSSQLPKDLVAQIVREQCKNQEEIDQKDRPCPALQKQVKETAGKWGPSASELPKLD